MKRRKIGPGTSAEGERGTDNGAGGGKRKKGTHSDASKRKKEPPTKANG